MGYYKSFRWKYYSIKFGSLDFLWVENLILDIPSIRINNGWSLGIRLNIGKFGLLLFRERLLSIETENVKLILNFDKNIAEIPIWRPSISPSISQDYEAKLDQALNDEDDKDNSVFTSFLQLFIHHFYLSLMKLLFRLIINFQINFKQISVEGKIRFGFKNLSIRVSASVDPKYSKRFTLNVRTRTIDFYYNSIKFGSILPIHFDTILSMYNRRCLLKCHSISLNLYGFEIEVDERVLDYILLMLEVVAVSKNNDINLSNLHSNLHTTLHPEYDISPNLLFWMPFQSVSSQLALSSDTHPKSKLSRHLKSSRDNEAVLQFLIKFLYEILTVKSKDYRANASQNSLSVAVIYRLFQWLPSSLKIYLKKFHLILNDSSNLDYVDLRLNNFELSLLFKLANPDDLGENLANNITAWLSDSSIIVNLVFQGPLLKLCTKNEIYPELNIGNFSIGVKSDLLFLQPTSHEIATAPIVPIPKLHTNKLKVFDKSVSNLIERYYYQQSDKKSSCWNELSNENDSDSIEKLVSLITVNIQFESIYLCIAPGLESWIDLFVRFSRKIQPINQNFSPAPSELPLIINLSWHSQLLLKLTTRLAINKVLVEIKSDYFKSTPNLLLGSIAVNDVILRNSMSFTVYNSYLSKDSTTFINKNSLVNRRNRVSSVENLSIPLFAPSSINNNDGLIFKSSYLALCSSVPIFTVGSANFYALGNRHDIFPNSSKFYQDFSFLELPFHFSNETDLVMKQFLNLSNINGQFTLKDGMLLDANNVNLWFLPSFLMLSGPILKLLFSYTSQFDLCSGDLYSDLIPEVLKNNLSLSVVLDSIIITANNWVVELPYTILSDQNNLESSNTGAFFISGGVATVHIRPDIKRWHVDIPHVSIYNHLFPFPENYEVRNFSDIIFGDPFMYVRSIILDGVDPVWNIVYDDDKLCHKMICPQQLNISANGVQANLSVFVNICILRIVKQFVAAVINFKASSFHQMWPVANKYKYLPDIGGEIAYSNFISEANDIESITIVNTFIHWYCGARATYLKEKFSYITFDATDISSNIYFDENLWMSLNCEKISSNFLPLEFDFKNLSLSFLSEPFINLGRLLVSRRGLNCKDIFADRSCKVSEYLFLFGEYADVMLQIQSVEVTLSRNIFYDSALLAINHYASAIIEIYSSLPTLDYLSKLLGGPGYIGPPSLPSPCVNLNISSVLFSVRDSPLESFLQNIYPIWHSTAIERYQRRELMLIKNKDVMASEKDAKKYDQLMKKMDSEYYMKKIKILEKTQNVFAGNLLKIKIDNVSISLIGKYGSFRSRLNMYHSLVALDEACQSVDDSELFSDQRMHSESKLAPDIFDVMIGTYLNINISGLSVCLRDFIKPLFVASKISVSGSSVIARHDTTAEHAEATVISIKPPFTAYSSELEFKTIVRNHHVPLKVFYDMDINMTGSDVTYYPTYDFSLYDLFTLGKKLSKLALTRSASSIVWEVDCANQLNIWDLLRLCFHGKAVIAVENIGITFFQGKGGRVKPDNINCFENSLNLHMSHLDVAYQASNLNINVLRTRVSLASDNNTELIINSDADNILKDELMCIPRVELQISCNWYAKCDPHFHYMYPISSVNRSFSKLNYFLYLIFFQFLLYSPNALVSNCTSPLILHLLSFPFPTLPHWIPTSEMGELIAGNSIRPELRFININTTVEYKEMIENIEELIDISSSQIIQNQSKLWQSIYPYLFHVQSKLNIAHFYAGIITVPYALSFAKSQYFIQASKSENRDPNEIGSNYIFDSYCATGLTICVSLVLPIAPVFFSTSRSTRKSLIAAKLPPRKDGLNTYFSLFHFLEFNSTFDPIPIEESTRISVHSGSIASLIRFAFEYIRLPAHFLPKRCLAACDSGRISFLNLIKSFVIEKCYIQNFVSSFWEGSSAGAARGVRVGIQGISFRLEFVSESIESLLRISDLNYNSSKIYMQLGSSIWAFQNIFLNLSNISGHILCSDEWKSMHNHDELDTFTDDIKTGKCVVSQVYENQRYVLGQGWSALNLLPTDIPPWSDESGSQYIDRDLIKVPSVDWIWTGDWAVDFRLRRLDEVDGCGFEYAFDFQNKVGKWKFIGKWTWFTSVRRRRWIRIRRLKQADTEVAKEIRTENTANNRCDFIFNVFSISYFQDRIQSSYSHTYVPILPSPTFNDLFESKRNQNMLDLFNINSSKNSNTALIGAPVDNRPKLIKQKGLSTTSLLSDKAYLHYINIANVKFLFNLDVRDVLLSLGLTYYQVITEILESLVNKPFSELSDQFRKDKNRLLHLDTNVENYIPIRENENDTNNLQLVSKSSAAPQLDASIGIIPGLHDFLLLEVECVQMNAVSADKGCVTFALVRTELTARNVWERKQTQKYYLSLAMDQISALVAPIDIDVDPLAIWLKRSEQCGWLLSSSILRPFLSPLPINLSAVLSHPAKYDNIDEDISLEIMTSDGNKTGSSTFDFKPDQILAQAQLNRIAMHIPTIDVSLTGSQISVLIGVINKIALTELPIVLGKSDDSLSMEKVAPLTSNEISFPAKFINETRSNRNTLAWDIRFHDWLLCILKNDKEVDDKTIREIHFIEQSIWTKLALANMKFNQILTEYRKQEDEIMAQLKREELRNIGFECYLGELVLKLLHDSCVPFFKASIKDLYSSVVVYEDSSGELFLEIKNVIAENLIDDDNWRNIISPLLSGDRGWTERDLIVTVHMVGRISNGIAIFPHLELNVHPLNVKMSYSIITELITCFTMDKPDQNFEHFEKIKKDFLPSSNNLLTTNHLRRDNFLLASPKELITASKKQMTPTDGIVSALSSNRKLLSTAMEIYSDQLKNEINEEAKKDDDKSSWFFFTYIRAGSFKVVVSYKGNGVGVEDFEGLKVVIKAITYQRKKWPLPKLFRSLQKELVSDLLSQIGGTLGSWLRFKIGFREDMKNRARGIVGIDDFAERLDLLVDDLPENDPDSDRKRSISLLDFLSIKLDKPKTKRNIIFGESSAKPTSTPSPASSFKSLHRSSINTPRSHVSPQLNYGRSIDSPRSPRSKEYITLSKLNIDTIAENDAAYDGMGLIPDINLAENEFDERGDELINLLK